MADLEKSRLSNLTWEGDKDEDDYRRISVRYAYAGEDSVRVQHGKCGEGVHQLQPQALRAGRSGAVRTHAKRWMAQRLGAGAWQWRCAEGPSCWFR